LRWLAQEPGLERTVACFDLLKLTADLDALTAGLLRDAVASEERACREKEKR
jgi:hypothetical protein